MTTPSSTTDPVRFAFRTFAQHWNALLPVMGAGFAITAALTLVWYVTVSKTMGFATDFSFLAMLAVVVLMVALVVCTIWYSAHLYMSLQRLMKGAALPSLAESRAKLPGFVGLSLLGGLIMAGPLALMVVVNFGAVIFATFIASPGGMPLPSSLGSISVILTLAALVWLVVACTRLITLTPVYLEGTRGIMESLRQTWEQSRGYFWFVFGWSIVLGIAALVLSIPLTILAEVVGDDQPLIAQLISSAGSSFLFGPLVVCFVLGIHQRISAPASKPTTV